MGYCQLTWVSDYTFKALFTRLKAVNKADWYFPPEVLNLTYDRVIVRAHGTYEWVDSLDLATPPQGEPIQIKLSGASGDRTITAAYYPNDHVASGVVVFPKQKDAFTSVSLVAEGRVHTLPAAKLDKLGPSRGLPRRPAGARRRPFRLP